MAPSKPQQEILPRYTQLTATQSNNPEIVLPAHSYVPASALPRGTCSMNQRYETPQIEPRYGISFDPNACYGPAQFAPVRYSRWLASLGTLYVVNYKDRSVGK